MPIILAIMNINWDVIPARLFTAAFVLTVVAYVVLIVFPRESWANFWFSGIIVPALLGIIYGVVMLIYFFLPDPNQVPPVGVSNPFDFLSLHGMRRLFLKDGLLLAGYLDLLLMPLAVAAWMARKAAQIRMPYLLLLPCLLLTFGVPGTGFVVFLILAALSGGLTEIARLESEQRGNTAAVSD